MADRALELAAMLEDKSARPEVVEPVASWYREAAALLRSLTADADALAEALEEYGVHQLPCPLAPWHEGRPTSDGGYETRYGDKWYPRGQEPECTCGLSAALARHDGGKG